MPATLVKPLSTRRPAPFSPSPGTARSAIFRVAIFSSLALAGCRLPCGTGAVTDDVLTCRQLTQQGIRAAESGDWQRAEDMLARAVVQCPTDADARRHHAEALWRRGQHDAAIAQIVEAIRLSETVDLLVCYAQMRLDAGQAELARQAAERAVALDPRSADAYALRARVMNRLANPRQALADYHAALACDASPPSLHLELAEVYWRLGQFQRTLTNVQTYLQATPDGEHLPRAHHLAGVAYLALDRPEEAAEHLALAAGNGPANSNLLADLATAHWRAGRPDEARAVVAQSLQSAPGHPASLALWERIPAEGDGAAGPYRR